MNFKMINKWNLKGFLQVGFQLSAINTFSNSLCFQREILQLIITDSSNYEEDTIFCTSQTSAICLVSAAIKDYDPLHQNFCDSC